MDFLKEKIAKNRITVKKLPMFILNFITCACILVFIAFISLLIINFARGDKQPVGILGIKILNVTSGSMQPYISQGDLAVISETNANDIKKGDVISFYVTENDNQLLNTKIVTHRVTAVTDVNNKPFFYTKGDKNNAPDDWIVPAQMVLGKMRFKIPFVGRLLTQNNILILLAVITLIMLVLIVLNALKLIKKKRTISKDKASELGG